ncbi:hypothetical protein JXR01_01175 [Candidatus Kaiserbacteria bacterium]|nr:MAG: hypothetical protein JXR01_01175 [Candidatus Kaiserbacteria bacterium]
MEKEKTHAVFSLNDGIFEVMGTEKFVREMIESFDKEIRNTIGQVKTKKVKNIPDKDNHKDDIADEHIGDDDFEDIAQLVDGEIRLVYDLQHKNNDKKNTQEAALIYLYLLEKLTGGDETKDSTSKIRSQCEKQGCLHKKNFAAHLKSQPKLITISGKGKDQVAALSNPGKKEAVKLIKSIRSNDESDSS